MRPPKRRHQCICSYCNNLPCAVLQYADHTLIVCQGDLNAASALKQIHDQFAAISRLHINYGKSTLVPIHMSEELTDECVLILGCSRQGFPQSYLGLPLSVNKLSVSAFTPYIQRADRYLSSWQGNLLN
jgi:hypothetical protein